MVSLSLPDPPKREHIYYLSALSSLASSTKNQRLAIFKCTYLLSVNTRAAARAEPGTRAARTNICTALRLSLMLTHSRHAAALRPRLSPIAGKRSCAGRPFAFFGARAGLPAAAAAAAAAAGMAPMRAEGSPP